MLELIHKVAAFLNQYASLLLVVLTAVYVVLNWRTLRALEKASLRDREAEHLQQIKSDVVQPILSWIGLTVTQRFSGKGSPILAVFGQQLSHTVDDPFVGRQRLRTPFDGDAPDELVTWTSLDADRISKPLYEHTKRDHFAPELRDFDQFLSEVRQVSGLFVAFANECAERIDKHPDREGFPSQPGATLQFVAECTWLHLQTGEWPTIIISHAQGPFGLALQLSGGSKFYPGAQPIKLERWGNFAVTEIQKRWRDESLGERTGNLLKRAKDVGCKVERLMLTHAIGVDCEFVSGRTK